MYNLYELQPVNAYSELLAIMKAFLQVRYPGKVVSIETNEDGLNHAVVVFGIGEHGAVRFALDYENHGLGES